jgi:sorting nexin-29
VRIKDEEWNIYKRYSEFRDLHLHLKKQYPIINKYDFPPKKSIGKKVKFLLLVSLSIP